MKKLISVLFLILMLASFALPFSALAEETRVYDDAGLFTEEQKAELETDIAELKTTTQLDFVLVTTNDAAGKSAEAYADDFYDSHEFGAGADHSGILYLIDMDNREAYFSTSGTAINIFTDHRIESMLDAVTPYLKSKSYLESAKSFLSEAEYYSNQGVENGQYQYNSDTGEYTYSDSEPLTMADRLLVAILLPLIASGIFIAVVLVKYSKKGKTCPYPFREQSVLELTRKEDIFLGTTMTQRHIDTNNGSGGGSGSSTHTSSSGRTHGGGGRGF